jgi:hypothetical protein
MGSVLFDQVSCFRVQGIDRRQDRDDVRSAAPPRPRVEIATAIEQKNGRYGSSWKGTAYRSSAQRAFSL